MACRGVGGVGRNLLTPDPNTNAPVCGVLEGRLVTGFEWGEVGVLSVEIAPTRGRMVEEEGHCQGQNRRVTDGRRITFEVETWGDPLPHEAVSAKRLTRADLRGGEPSWMLSPSLWPWPIVHVGFVRASVSCATHHHTKVPATTSERAAKRRGQGRAWRRATAW